GLANRDLLLGIRAEAITVETEPGDGLICAAVVVVEPLGSHNLITARAADEVLKISAPNHFFPEPGDDIWLRFRPAQIRWLDRETGKVVPGSSNAASWAALRPWRSSLRSPRHSRSRSSSS